MDNSVLSLQEVQGVWALYYVAAVGLWLLCAWALKGRRCVWCSLVGLSAVAGLLFTPWFITDSQSDMAPAFLILLAALRRHHDIVGVLIPMLFVALAVLFMLACGVGIARWRRSS